MSLTTISGGITHFPKLGEMTEDDVIFEKGKYVGTGPNKFGGVNCFFEVEDAIKTDKGETNRVGLSAGQITTAMENEGHMGGWYKITYKGKKEIQDGQWKGSKAHTFQIQRYDEDTKMAAKTSGAGNAKTAQATQTDLPLGEETAKTTGDLNAMM